MADTQPHKAVILIVEDQRDLLDDLAAVLTEEGYRALPELSADTARQVLQREIPDLILCDIAMPGADGMAFLREIRADRPDLDQVPFIMLSAFSDREDVVAGKQAGADDYLVKPVDYDLLLATVEARLREVGRLRGGGSAKAPPAPDSTGVSPVLDQLDFALVLVDGAGEVSMANRSARLMAEAEGRSLRGWASQITGEICLQSALAEARAAVLAGTGYRRVLLGQGDDGSNPDFPETPCDDELPAKQNGGLDARCVVALADLGCVSDDPSVPVLMVMVFSDLSDGRSGARLITEAAGLTAAETEVALLLARGARPADVAQSLNISKTTVSYHLRNIFQKTATSRQADLVALLRSLPLQR